MEQEFMVYDTVMKLKVTHPEEFRPMPEPAKEEGAEIWEKVLARSDWKR